MTDLTPPEARPPGLRLHKRTMHVSSRRARFQKIALDFEEENDLTLPEMAIILTECLSSVHRSMLRAERHPDDPGRKADEE